MAFQASRVALMRSNGEGVPPWLQVPNHGLPHGEPPVPLRLVELAQHICGVVLAGSLRKPFDILSRRPGQK